MKALSLTQPWATLVAIGAKHYETRSWSTPFRGRIAIAASKGFPGDCRELCMLSPFAGVLYQAGYTNIASVIAECGNILAVATIVGVGPTEACSRRTALGGVDMAEHEESFGDYSPGRCAWGLADVVRLPRPVPAKGALGLWTLPPDVERAVMVQL